MPRLTAGGKMPSFTFSTPFETGRTMAETANRVKGKTAVVFLRYFGCTLCQYDMRQFAAEYSGIAATGGQLIVVLQSDPAKLAKELKLEDFPFEIICDTEQKLYRDFEIAPAKSKMEMADAKTLKKLAKVTLSGLRHGDYEGDELQLPAVFVVTPDLTVVHVHYGKAAGDVPTPKELTELLAYNSTLENP